MWKHTKWTHTTMPYLWVISTDLLRPRASPKWWARSLIYLPTASSLHHGVITICFLFLAIEAWVIVCVLFVFGALIEYAGLLLKIKIGTTKGVPRVPKKSPSVNRENSLALNGNVEDRKATLRSLTRKKQRDDMSHARLDILFLLLFPLFFLIFNVIYWVSFMYGGPCLDCEEEWLGSIVSRNPV